MRIAIVNDMPMAVQIQKRILTLNNSYSIAWVAQNGKEAIEKCKTDLPDLILMDIFMPGINGVEATKTIMEQTPCPILLVTVAANSNQGKVFEAMGAGALDVVATPSVSEGGTIDGDNELMKKITLLQKIISNQTVTKKRDSRPDPGVVIAIGSSTGGPKALATILEPLPQNMNASVVIVQHIDMHFAEELALWLNKYTEVEVKLITDGMRLEKGNVYIAGTNDHLILNEDLTFSYTVHPAGYPYRPSVDVFFKSLVSNYHKKGVGVLLTGMGRDGAEGLLALKQSGWFTIAQNKESSIVYGMPRAAVEINAATVELPLADIIIRIKKEFSL